MADDDEPIVLAPPFVQVCRALDHLWMAGNAMSHINSRKADKLRQEVDEIRKRFALEILPVVLKKETLG